uniref:Uncharacterized protein n=1 Tax=Amphora coffeiformis TaxID=265554 RepID=A0A7S3P8M8_9STRA
MVMNLLKTDNDESERQLTPDEIRRATGFNPRPVRDRNNFSPEAIRQRTGFNPTLAKYRPPPPPLGRQCYAAAAVAVRNNISLPPPSNHPSMENDDDISDVTLDDRLAVPAATIRRGRRPGPLPINRNNFDDDDDDDDDDDSDFPSLDDRFVESASVEEPASELTVEPQPQNDHPHGGGGDDESSSFPLLDDRFAVSSSACASARRYPSSHKCSHDNHHHHSTHHREKDESTTAISLTSEEEFGSVPVCSQSNQISNNGLDREDQDEHGTVVPSSFSTCGDFDVQNNNHQKNNADRRRQSAPPVLNGNYYYYNRAPSEGSLAPPPPRYYQSARMFLTKGSNHNNDNNGLAPSNNVANSHSEHEQENQDEEPTNFDAPEARCYPPPHPPEASSSPQPIPNNYVANNKPPLPPEAAPRALPFPTLMGEANVNDDETHYTAPEPQCYPPPPPPFLQSPPIQPPPRPPPTRANLPPPLPSSSVGRPVAAAGGECEFYQNPTILGLLIQTFRYREARRRLEQNGLAEAAVWVVARRQNGKEKDSAVDDESSNYAYRRLPLHIATDALSSTAVMDNPGLRGELEALIGRLLYAYPKGCSERDHEGNLPLHHAVRYNAAPETISNLLVAYPEALREKDPAGKDPLALSEFNYNNQTVNKLLRLKHDFWVKAGEETRLRLKHRHIPLTQDSVASMSVLAGRADGFGQNVNQINSFDDDTLVTMDETSLRSVANSYFEHRNTGANDIYFEPPATRLCSINEEDDGAKAKNTTSERMATIIPEPYLPPPNVSYSLH